MTTRGSTRLAATFSLWMIVLSACTNVGNGPAWIAERPDFRMGDRWVYSIHTVRASGASVDRRADDEMIAVAPDTMVVRRTIAGATTAPVETVFQRDWSRLRPINGVETTIARDLSFPLEPGKTWSNTYLDTKPGEPSVTLRRTYRYRVAARESIDVAGGHFDAIRIETDGDWHREFPAAEATGNIANPDAPDAASLRFTSWYAPSIGRFVRFEEDVRLPSGALFSHTVIELQSVVSQAAPRR